MKPQFEKSNTIFIQLEKHAKELKRDNKKAHKSRTKFSSPELFVAGALLCAIPLFLIMRIDLWGEDSGIAVSAWAVCALLYLWLFRYTGTTALIFDLPTPKKTPGLPRSVGSRVQYAQQHVCDGGLGILHHSKLDLEEALLIASFNIDDFGNSLKSLGILSTCVGLFAFNAEKLVTMAFPEETGSAWFTTLSNLDFYPVALVIVTLAFVAVLLCFQPFRWSKYKSAISYALTQKANAGAGRVSVQMAVGADHGHYGPCHPSKNISSVAREHDIAPKQPPHPSPLSQSRITLQHSSSEIREPQNIGSILR